MRFLDRRQAGRALAERLLERQRAGRLPDPLVLALPRGGVPVADEIARALDAPLDVLVVRKVGLPSQPELGVGAVTGTDPPLYDTSALNQLGLTEDDLAPVAERERAELRRREAVYREARDGGAGQGGREGREGRPAPDPAGRSVVLVDDGLATGSTARAALRSARRGHPAHLLLAVPVCSREGARALRDEGYEVECLYQPPVFRAVGFWYDDFDQLTDEDVLKVLRGD